VIVIVAAACRQTGLTDELRSIEAELAKNGYTDTALARRVADLRPLVIEANDPVIDSVFNRTIRLITDTTRYLRDDLWLYSAVMRGDISALGSLDLGLAHDLRYWGNYDAARSIYGRIAVATSMSNPNAVANLGMEYERVGLTDLAIRYITMADSVFSLQSDVRGRIWMQRLFYNLYMKSGRIQDAQRCLSTYQDLHRQIFRVAAWQMVDTVTDVNLVHSILEHSHWRQDLGLAYGDSAMHYLNLYKVVTTSTEGRWRNALLSDGINAGPLPKPVIRTLPADGGRIFSTDSLVKGQDGSLAFSTRFGTYQLRGNRWFLTTTADERHANVIASHEQQRVVPLLHTTSKIECVVPLSDDTLAIFSRDSIRLINGQGHTISLTPAPQHRNGKVIQASALGKRYILVVCSNGILLFDRTSLRLLSQRTFGGSGDGSLPISFGSAGAIIVPLSDNLVLIKRHGSVGYIGLEISENSPALQSLVITDQGNRTLRNSVIFQESQILVRSQWERRGSDSLCLSNREVLTELSSGSRGEDRPVTGVRAAYPLLAMQQYDNIDIIDTRTMQTYPQFARPIPIEVRSNDIIGIYRDAAGTLNGYYASGRDLVRFNLSQRGFPLRPSLYLMEHNRSATTPTECLPLSSGNRVAAGSTYTITTASNLVTSQFPLQYLIQNHRGSGWQASDVTSFWSVTFTPTYSDDAVAISTPLHNKTISIAVTYPIVSRPWFMPAVSGIIAALLGITAFNVIKVRRRRQRETIEAAKSEQLELLREDMHDMIGSRLVRIASLTRQASPENSEEVLSRIHDMTLVTVRSLRNLLTLMSEGAMTDAEFYGSIREYVMESCRDSGLAAAIEIDIHDFDRTTLDNSGRHELLMIVSEMLTNTVRHAQATNVRFRVVVSDDITLLQWSDNGVGLALDAQRGNGLNNIQRRASRINATVNIESAPDLGTRYTLTFPMRKETKS